MTMFWLCAHVVAPGFAGWRVAMTSPRHWPRRLVMVTGALAGIAAGALFDTFATMAGH
jgi:hypothetical protein